MVEYIVPQWQLVELYPERKKQYFYFFKILHLNQQRTVFGWPDTVGSEHHKYLI